MSAGPRRPLAALAALLASGCTSYADAWATRVADELRARPLRAAPVLAEADLAPLPAPVRRYVLRSGAVGRPRVQRFRVRMDAEMRQAPGAAPMSATAEQVSFVDRPARLFLMKARMWGLPVAALHVYADAQATFRVRVASLVNVVDEQGAAISAGETVTVLNDLCIFAPGALVDPRIAWEAIDDRTARAIFTSGPHRVSATLRFDEEDRLVDFVSSDRPEFRDGTYRHHPWSTPLREYRDFGGLRLASRGDAVYREPGGDFVYGRFVVTAVEHDPPDGALAPGREGR